ncbi:MAG: hypothetical protein OJJ21_07165 [Ferrovibrio sp.]|uniref:hypothetical protein n=1 Tax=Ferrovibrio sp. TaxID=1917215 RepID=UPI00262F8F88|nr:hypothetical protein [Ferrovibrio sp.]MCW0233360.1 hypothetical protein [Ferrovibrio sp.]
MSTTRPYAALLFLLLPLLAFLALANRFPIQEPLLQTDSEGYLTFSSIRTGGYPFFLALLKPFVSDLSGYIPIQLALYGFACCAFAYVFWRAYGAILPALLAEIVLLGNPLANAFHFTITTESLFLTVSVLFFAASFSALHGRHITPLICASLLAGIAVTIRPTGLALLPALAVLPFMLRSDGLGRRCLFAAMPCLAVLALEATYYRAHNGPDRQSLLPIVLLAKGGMVSVPDADAIIAAAPETRRALDRALETDLAKVRQLIAESPNLPATCRLIDGYEPYIQYRFALTERATAQAAGGTQALKDAAIARMLTAPTSYMENVWQHWLCLWTLWAATGAEKQAFRVYLEQNQPIPYIPEILDQMRPGDTLPFTRLVIALLWMVAAGLAAAGGAAVYAALRGRFDAGLATAGLAGIVAHGALVMTAAMGVSIPRYTVGFWPALAIGAGMLVWFGLKRFYRPSSQPLY